MYHYRMALLVIVSAPILVAAAISSAGYEEGGRMAVPPAREEGFRELTDMGKIPNFIDNTIHGWVTAVDDSSITLTYPVDRVGKFRAVGVLAEGRFAEHPSHVCGYPTERWKHAYYYTLSDVRVGDRVAVKADRVNWDSTCREVSIERRPGGRVPPARYSKGPRAHHIAMNAWQDFEENGTPLPEWLRPTPPPPVTPRKADGEPKRNPYAQPEPPGVLRLNVAEFSVPGAGPNDPPRLIRFEYVTVEPRSEVVVPQK
jgi:hypothetical protein